MTRKHFAALAQSLAELKRDLDRASADGCDNSIDTAFGAHLERVVGICAESNAGFSAETFRAAVRAGA